MNIPLPIHIEVETSTYCNRVCNWCPNAYHKRGKERKYIDEEIWTNFLSELSFLQYQGRFSFHNYNEPLLDPSIVEKVKQARSYLNKAYLSLYTNGDPLKPKLLSELSNAGLDELRITLYPNEKGVIIQQKRLTNLANKLSIVLTDSFVNHSSGIEYQAKLGRLLVRFIVPDVTKYGSRGGDVKCNDYESTTLRSSPCYQPTIAAAIDVEGNLKLCCEIYSAKDNEEYTIGNLKLTSFTNLWESEKLSILRHKLSTADFFGLGKCQKCRVEPKGFERRHYLKS